MGKRLANTVEADENYSAVLAHSLDLWNPDKHSIHCNNCSHTRVSSESRRIRVRCLKGHGTNGIDLVRLIRPKTPLAFISAKTCPDFDIAEEIAVAGPRPEEARP